MKTDIQDFTFEDEQELREFITGQKHLDFMKIEIHETVSRIMGLIKHHIQREVVEIESYCARWVLSPYRTIGIAELFVRESFGLRRAYSNVTQDPILIKLDDIQCVHTNLTTLWGGD